MRLQALQELLDDLNTKVTPGDKFCSITFGSYSEDKGLDVKIKGHVDFKGESIFKVTRLQIKSQELTTMTLIDFIEFVKTGVDRHLYGRKAS